MRFPRIIFTLFLIVVALPLLADLPGPKIKPQGLDIEKSIHRQLHQLDLPFELTVERKSTSLIHKYLTKYRGGTESLLSRMPLYLPIFEECLKKHDLPVSLKYLPMVESRLKPHAVSKVGAVGLWQFMPYTAKQYDLKITKEVDERRDPYKSTEAAIKFLKDLHAEFNDWTLALAAYNCGPNRVRKAIKKANCPDYSAIEAFLPAETRMYIPKFIAFTFISQNHSLFGLKPANRPFFKMGTKVVRITEQYTFKQISHICNMPRYLIIKLNPSYLQGFLPKNEAGNYLILPTEASLKLNRFLSVRNIHEKMLAFRS